MAILLRSAETVPVAVVKLSVLFVKEAPETGTGRAREVSVVPFLPKIMEFEDREAVLK
jgi:hypothetical protein